MPSETLLSAPNPPAPNPPAPDATEAALADLAPLVERQALRFGRETRLEGLTLARETVPSGPLRTLYRPSLVVVVRGAKTTVLGDRRFRYRAGECLLAGLHLPVATWITQASEAEPYLALGLTIDPETVAAFLQRAETGNRTGEAGLRSAEVPGGAGEGGFDEAEAAYAPSAFEPLQVAPMDPALADPLARLLRLLDTPRDLPVLAPLVRQEIVWRVLTGPLGPRLRRVGFADARAARIGQATATLRARHAEPIRVATLARDAGMSVASFHRHFKAVTTLTPVQFQKLVRLQEARRRLLGAEEVAGVAYAVGYESPSQFSRDYRRLFGQAPGRDGASMRAHLGFETADGATGR